jgi:putative transposase
LEIRPRRASEENLKLMEKLDERYLEKPTHGVLRMQDYLADQGYVICEKCVRRLIRKMGLMAIYPKPNLSKLGQAKYIYPY